MPLIDQRILIDAPAEAVWEVLSDPTMLPRWHAGCTGISVLTTLPTGVGARWRCSPPRGKDVILQVTAWVDGLGYEYSMVEGGAYRSYQARFRLQPGPDGTSVQWTLTYQPRGLFGALRDRFRGRRAQAAAMAASLRRLKHEVDLRGVRMAEEMRARFLIQERLSVDERAQYSPRHARPVESEIAVGPLPASEAEAEAVPDAAPVDPSAPSFVNEIAAEDPQVLETAEADTRPKPPPGLHDAIEAAAVAPAPEDEAAQFGRPEEEPRPDSLDELPLSERLTPPEGTPIITPEMRSVGSEDITDDRIPAAQPPEGWPNVAAPTSEPPLPPPPDEALQPPPAPPAPLDPTKTPPHGIPAVGGRRSDLPKTGPLRRTPPMGVQPVTSMDADQDALPEGTVLRRDNPQIVREVRDDDRLRRNLPPPTPKYDTGEITIWEAFGIQRPSEVDSAALDELIETVQRRERAALWLESRYAKRPAHVRFTDTALGLRVRLALDRAPVRISHVSPESGKPGA